MVLAELHGKLSRNVERMEDILTSNVFSFFKYACRDIFLKRYLEDLLDTRFKVNELNVADFVFWPSYEDGTEPDLVMVVGPYYLLFEAKYFSDFGKETPERKDQITREIEGGSIEAKRLGKRFEFVAVTADSVFRKEKFSHLTGDLPERFHWTNWQAVASLLEEILAGQNGLAPHELCHAQDLLDLLDRKNLRSFRGFTLEGQFTRYDRIFFDADSASYRGSFIGFQEALGGITRIDPAPQPIFFQNAPGRSRHSFFQPLREISLDLSEHDRIFFQRRST
jgi:hypothetical protein